MAGQGWRPPQWASQPQLVYVSYTEPTATVGVSTTTLGVSNLETGGTPIPPVTTPGQPVIFYFDAVFSTDHYLTRRFTQHPVQNNTSITDHSFNLPDRVVIGVGFSDAMQSFSNGQYTSSIDAFTKFVALKEQGQQLYLATRLKQYGVMGIESIRAADTLETSNGVKFVITFIQIIIAQTSTTVVQSSRPDSSQQTSTGNTQSVTVPTSIYGTNTTLTPAATPPSAPVTPNPNPNWNSDPVGWIGTLQPSP